MPSVKRPIPEFRFYEPKPTKTIRQIVYDDRDGTLCGRTPRSWGLIFLFYVIFYIVLALIFMIGIIGLFATLSDTEPKWKLAESLIGTNPGLSYRPQSWDNKRDSVIQFNRKNPGEVGYWTDLLDDFLMPYNATPSQNQRVCSFDQLISTNTTSMPVCLVDIGIFAKSCSPSTGYGYKSGRPCVLLKLNRIYGWVPQVYDNLADLPENMPDDLKEYIANVPARERQQVWVSCTGQQQQKHPVNNVTYVGSRGFPSYYYPYLNQPGYLSPLVAVQFQEITVSQLIAIECRAWAKNIIYKGNNIRGRQGSVSFEFLMN